jgi:hypothetical protein
LFQAEKESLAGALSVYCATPPGVDPELGTLARADRQAAVLAFVARSAAVDGDAARAAFAIEAVVAVALDDEAPFVGRQLERAGVREIRHAHIGAAVLELELHPLVVERGDFELAVRIQPQRGRADLQLDAPVTVGREAISGADRLVAHRTDPFARVRAVEPDLAAEFGQPGNAPRRIGRGFVLRKGRARREHQRGGSEQHRGGEPPNQACHVASLRHFNAQGMHTDDPLPVGETPVYINRRRCAASNPGNSTLV